MDLDPLNRSKGKPGNKGWGGKPAKGGGKGYAGKKGGKAEIAGNWRVNALQCMASRQKAGTTKMTRSPPALGLSSWVQ